MTNALFFTSLILPAALFAQPSTTRRSDGSIVDTNQTATGYQRVQKVQSLNGRMVPNESVEEHVISQDDSGSVVERIVRRYDPNGNPGPPEKIRIEEKKRSDGGSTVKTTVFRGDINGRMEPAERSTQETRKSGDTLNSETVVERTSINGAFDVVEKKELTSTKSGDQTREEATVFRKNISGSFVQAVRRTVERTEHNGEVNENAAQFEPGPAGTMRITKQTITHAVTRPDGSASTEVDLYDSTVVGRAGDSQSPQPTLREQQLIEAKPGPGNTVIETVSARRPGLADAGKVSGPFQKISEAVCTGKCK